jgi:C4-dicarboxylate-specific signal transduction histidine kinase
MELSLDKSNVDTLYPFYLGIDLNGYVKSFGRSAPKTFLNLSHETLVSDIFELMTPKLHVDLKDLKKLVGKLISLKSKTTELTFNGEVLWIKSNEIFLFAITPLVQNVEVITKFHLTYNDFPVYSPVFDFFILIHAEQFARKLQTKAIQELEEQNNFAKLNLEVANFCSNCSSAEEALQFTINAIEKSFQWKGNYTIGLESPPSQEISMPIMIDGQQRFCISFSPQEKINPSEAFKIFLASLTFTLENLIKRIDQYNAVLEAQMIKVHSSKMSTLGEMAAGIAHELNNPLAIIHGMAWMTKTKIVDGSSKAEMIVENLDKIMRMTERSTKIIKGLRVFSRDAVNDAMEKVELNRVIEDTLELCKSRVQNKHIRLVWEVVGEYYTWGKAVQISQVVLNLINNASDAIEGSVDPWIKIQIKQNDKMWEISVTDSGLGIPKAIAEKMMQPFYTTKAPGKGTGLGLSISHTILQNHNGKFWYDQNNENTSFILSLPIYLSNSTT